VTSPVRPETDRKIDELLTRFPMKGSALLPALYLVQEEKGHVSEESMEYLASKIGVSAAFVSGVVSFYTMFHRKPVGRHHIQVCRTLPCALRGADDLMAHLKKRLGVADGERVADGSYSIVSVECLGACDRAPFIQINDEEHGPVDAARMDEILKGLERRP
jgi:NADH-quinone oxidoreductase subunit E